MYPFFLFSKEQCYEALFIVLEDELIFPFEIVTRHKHYVSINIEGLEYKMPSYIYNTLEEIPNSIELSNRIIGTLNTLQKQSLIKYDKDSIITLLLFRLKEIATDKYAKYITNFNHS